MRTPVGIVGIGLAPLLDLINQGQALSTMLCGFMLDFVQPGLNHFVGVVASCIKTFPKCMVGQAALVGLLPIFTQLAQGLLHLAATDGRLQHKVFCNKYFGCLYSGFCGCFFFQLCFDFIFDFCCRFCGDISCDISCYFCDDFSWRLWCRFSCHF